MIKLMPAGITPATLLFVFIVSANDCLAQLADNFSDGNYETNPAWFVDAAANWIVENEILRSNSATASSSFYISASSATASNAQWDFLVNLKFNTSGANYVDVFLTSNQSDLSSATIAGYFVRLGGTPDEVSLYRSDSGTSTILIDGTNGTTASTDNLIRVKVTRTIDSEWTLLIATSGDTNYQLEGSATDATYQTSQYFGIKVTQSTSSFFGKHYFDDFYVGDIILDTTAPTLNSVVVISSSEIELVFDEQLDETSAENPSNYSIDNSIGPPLTALLQAGGKSVRLQLVNPMLNLGNYSVTVNGVMDLSGNAIVSDQQSFDYYEFVEAKYKDLIITEIFPDPDPVIGLPDGEFIEVYNRSDHVFDLKNWQVTDGSSYATMPAFLLLPGHYAVITSSSLISAFQPYGHVVGVSNFPTLNNSSDQVGLISPEQLMIDIVNYDDSWYGDEDKRQGGWSLELIDVENICGEGDNWVAAENEIGGTPGTVNSVDANNPDVTGPKLISAIPISSTAVKLVFNEKLSTEIPSVDDVTITDRELTQVELVPNSTRELVVTVSSPLSNQETYTVTVTNAYDCPGNMIQIDFQSAIFGLPGQVEPGDVLINEVLFNPKPFGVDFVEFYNASNKFITIKDWTIGNYVNEELVNWKPIIEEDRLIFPKDFFVVTTDALTLKAHYPNSVEKNIILVKSMPSLSDDEGTVAMAIGDLVLDDFSYSKDFHSMLLKDMEGVSLERISTTSETNSADNWQSASSTVGYATPGYQNSNSRTEPLSTGTLKVDPEVFEPLVGQPSFTQISYKLDRPGMSANISILDQQGRIIKEIANNELLGSEGFFRWDGDTDHGTKARSGYYIVWAELFDLDGEVFTYKKRVVIASKF